MSLGIGRLCWLALIGGAATVIYAALAWAGTVLLTMPAALASVIAYALAALFSYLGHYRFTFQSNRPHRESGPRFAVITALGYAVALLVPWLLTDRLGLHPLVAIVVTCFAVPVLNILALARLVFRASLFQPKKLESRGDRI